MRVPLIVVDSLGNVFLIVDMNRKLLLDTVTYLIVQEVVFKPNSCSPIGSYRVLQSTEKMFLDDFKRSFVFPTSLAQVPRYALSQGCLMTA